MLGMRHKVVITVNIGDSRLFGQGFSIENNNSPAWPSD